VSARIWIPHSFFGGVCEDLDSPPVLWWCGWGIQILADTTKKRVGNPDPREGKTIPVYYIASVVFLIVKSGKSLVGDRKDKQQKI
jgi:hypothetical protein